MIRLCLASMDDSDRLLSWRNDPDTVKNSLSGKTVTAEGHAEWMRQNVMFGFPTSLLLIAFVGTPDTAIGVLRFNATDLEEYIYEVSINMNPSYRGQGLGWRVLEVGIDKMRGCGLIARIKAENLASRRIFRRNNFVEYSSEADVIIYIREREGT